VVVVVVVVHWWSRELDQEQGLGSGKRELE